MQELVVTARDGGQIEAYWLEGGRTAVILGHGKAFDRDSFVGYGQSLQALGYAVAILNFRGYGHSTSGTEGPDAIELDVLAVAQALWEQGKKPVALGASRGGGAVLRACAAQPSLFQAVITWSTVRVDDQVAQGLGTLPKLFIASESEPMRDQTLAVYQAAPEPKLLHWMPGGRHAQKIWEGPDRARLEQVVADFLASLDQA
jgi:pimeloyl-ACP methyl ester carboxylesterase